MELFDKAALRRAVRARLAQIDADEKQERSKTICDEVKKHLAVSGAGVVALFSPLGDEPQLWPLVEYLAGRLSVVLPRVEGEIINFYSYDKGVMAIGAYGINEPQQGVLVEPCEIDAIIVPGVAFTERGARMGRGKGYYDKYLSQNDFSALKIGVGYREQIVPEIPMEPHDVSMDVVIYE
jgi:5-formyltetrahydrofolate cyclo-ligase